MTSSGPPAPAAHSTHDLLLISALVAGDAGPADAREARALLVACDDCASVAGDLRAIAAATRALRDEAAPVPAGRHFTLDTATATRLRSGAWWRRLVGGSRAAWVLRPLGGAVAALGLAGLLLAAIPQLPYLGATSERDTSGEQAPGASDGGGLTPADMSFSPGPKDLVSAAPAPSAAASGDGRTAGGGTNGGGTGGEGAYSGGGGGAPDAERQGDAASLVERLLDRLPLVALSVVLLAGGLSLVLRRSARRLS